SDAWTPESGALRGEAAAASPAIAVAEVGAAINPNAFLELTATLTLLPGAIAGMVYDLYDARTFKFVLLDLAGQSVVFGHMRDGQLVIDQRVSRALTAGTAHTMLVTLKGASVSVMLNGFFVASRAYNAALADGRFGLLVTAGSASFDALRVRT